MKPICILLLIVSLGSVFSSSRLNLASFEILFNNTESKKQTEKFYYNVGLFFDFEQLDQSDVTSTIFNLVWEFQNADEASKAQKSLNTLSPVFEDSKIDDSSLTFSFYGHHMATLLYTRKSEFGTVYRFEIKQHDKIISVSIMIKKYQDAEPAFENIINGIFPTEIESKELKFLA